MTEIYTGKRIFLDTLRAQGVHHIFGNPGTTELPIIDGLIDYPDIRYITALHEAVAVTMADAYAQATGSVGVVNVHVAPGLGNALGSLYNAGEGRTPLLLTAGQQDTRMRLRDPLLGHDLVAMAAPLCKWSVQAESADELALLLHRAFKIAREAPGGPVFVALPINVMDQRTAHAALAPSRVYGRCAPDPEGIADAIRMLARARSPCIICGDEVARAGAVTELVAVAERLGATVWGEVLPARVNFPNQHPQFRGRMAQDQGRIRRALADADLVFLIGGEFFEEIWYAPDPPFPGDAARIHLESTPTAIARNYRVDCGLVGDIKVTLGMLDEALAAHGDPRFAAAAAARRSALRSAREAARAARQARADAPCGARPMSTARLMASLRDALPGDVVVAGEPISAGHDLLATLRFDDPTDYLASRGGGIGQGLPSAVGLKLAWPERPVLAISGDGSALYAIQALWSAAHHRLPIVFLILANRAYRILKLNMNRYRAAIQTDAARAYPGLDLTEPGIDFVALARGFGVAACRVEDAASLAGAVREAVTRDAPYLIEVLVDGTL